MTTVATTTSKPTQPTANKERIQSLDVLRGIAVLGILLMNIQSFSTISAAYSNPTAYGSLEGFNYWVWGFCHLFASTKFMSIFSLLFGAGIVLFADRAEKSGKKVVGLHYRRNFLLLLFGLVHAYFIWYGDVLFAYAILSFLWFWVRKWSPTRLFNIGLFFFNLLFLISMFLGSSMLYYPPETYTEISQMWLPDAVAIQKEIATYTGSYLGQMPERATTAFALQSFVFLIDTFWRVSAWMLVGMALYKWGYLSAKKSTKTYVLMVLCLIPGFAIILFGIDQQFGHGWTMEYSMYQGTMFNYVGTFFVVAGYVGLTMLWVKSNFLNGVKKLFASTGRMALTNYLLQSIICTFIFYGHGLGLFGSVSRVQQMWILLVVWIFQLLLSHFWLKYFKFGPFEWLWRSLTYGKLVVNLRDKPKT